MVSSHKLLVKVDSSRQWCCGFVHFWLDG